MQLLGTWYSTYFSHTLVSNSICLFRVVPFLLIYYNVRGTSALCHGFPNTTFIFHNNGQNRSLGDVLTSQSLGLVLKNKIKPNKSKQL